MLVDTHFVSLFLFILITFDIEVKGNIDLKWVKEVREVVNSDVPWGVCLREIDRNFKTLFNSNSTFPSLKNSMKQMRLSYAKSLFIMENVNYFCKKPVQVWKYAIAV